MKDDLLSANEELYTLAKQVRKKQYAINSKFKGKKIIYKNINCVFDKVDIFENSVQITSETEVVNPITSQIVIENFTEWIDVHDFIKHAKSVEG